MKSVGNVRTAHEHGNLHPLIVKIVFHFNSIRTNIYQQYPPTFQVLIIQTAEKVVYTFQLCVRLSTSKRCRYIQDFVTMTTGKAKQCGGKTVVTTAISKNKISLI